LLPLNNPHGYVNNWRYLNMATYSETVEGQSVGDSSHLLPNPADPLAARAPAPSSAEADALTSYLLALAASYPPAVSLDLHEDNLIGEGYVYSQGISGPADPLALAAIGVLEENGIPLKISGETRFGEPIEGGVIGPVVDSSIDELMSSATVIVGGRPQPGPSAETVLVFETPASEVELPRRINAHTALLKKLAPLLAVTGGLPAAGLGTDAATTIYLVRHAEKEAAGPDPALSAAGRQRATELGRLLQDAGIEAIYSTDVTRTLETATPLAQQRGLQIRIYDWDGMEELAASLLRQGGRYLVVGHSDTTPELVGLLGGEPGTAIDEADEYDRLYVVSVAPDGKVTSELRRFGRPFSP
jgi:broad specificity phosphatase PhoE